MILNDSFGLPDFAGITQLSNFTLYDLMGLFLDTTRVRINIRCPGRKVDELYDGRFGDIPCSVLDDLGEHPIFRFGIFKDPFAPDHEIVFFMELFRSGNERNEMEEI